MAPATASTRAGPEARPKTKAGARIETELEATARAEVHISLKAGPAVTAVGMVADVLVKVASSLATLLVGGPAVSRAEADSKAARRRGEWVSHECFLTHMRTTQSALSIRRRYIGNYRDATYNGVAVATGATTTTPVVLSTQG
jgi:hypothetical protein